MVCRARSFQLVIVGAWLEAAPLAAQYAQCGDPVISPTTTEACRVAVDAARAFQPLAGIVVSGGTTLLGDAGALGGAGHFAVTTRVNAVGASIPDVNSTSGAIRSTYAGLIPAPIVEAGAGLWRRVDLVGSALLLPTGIVTGLAVGPNAPHIGGVALGLSLGARFTAVQPALPFPTVTLSVMRRWMPEIRYGDPPDTTQPNRYQFSANLQALNARVHTGWRIGPWDLGVGLGLDHYHSNVRASGHNVGFGLGGVATWDTGPFAVATTRAVAFADGDLRFARLQLAGEVGYAGGTSQTFTTNFSDFDPRAGHVFGGLGLRVGF